MSSILAKFLLLSIKHLLLQLIHLKSHKFMSILNFAEQSATTLEAV